MTKDLHGAAWRAGFCDRSRGRDYKNPFALSDPRHAKYIAGFQKAQVSLDRYEKEAASCLESSSSGENLQFSFW